MFELGVGEHFVRLHSMGGDGRAKRHDERQKRDPQMHDHSTHHLPFSAALAAPWPSFQTPCFFSASATSRGM